jgi:hypothetical protein
MLKNQNTDQQKMNLQKKENNKRYDKSEKKWLEKCNTGFV